MANTLLPIAFILTPLFAYSQTDVWEEEAPTKGAEAKVSESDSYEQAMEAESMRTASSKTVRRFHEVLNELLAEFGYDVKLGQMKGLKNLAIRRIRVSQAIPRTYEEYLELLITERIRENSQVRLISCVPCKTRTSSLVGGKLMITSPSTNLAKLESAANILGIDYFLDGVLVYHTTHMVLALNVFNTKTKELVWTRTYNSETIKSRYQKLAIDYSQVAKSRPGEDYEPEYRFLFGLGGAGIPNIGGSSADSTMLNLQIRATEKFNNRKTEFGMLLSLLKTTASLMKAAPTDATAEEETATDVEADEVVVVTPAPKAFETAIGLFALYGHTFLGSVESYNEVRHGLHFGFGGLLAKGYMAPMLRGGWDIYFGRRFSTNIGLNYIATSTILVEGEQVKTKGGIGGDLVISLNY